MHINKTISLLFYNSLVLPKPQQVSALLFKSFILVDDNYGKGFFTFSMVTRDLMSRTFYIRYIKMGAQIP